MSKNQKVGNQLAYSVFKISSEDSSYPASELINTGKYAKGWQSQRFCSYPQIVLIQFPSTVKIRLIQILCHEYKIPSEVELISITRAGEKSQRLGSFKLQDNSSTQFKARELKSVFVESECRYLKLVLYKPHPNTKNLFSQVSMISLSVFGDFLDYENEYISSLKTLDPIRGLSEQFKARDRGIYTPQGSDPGVGMYFSRPNFTSRQSRILKDLFSDKLKALDNEKRRAVQINDADKAQKLKRDIDKTMKFAKLAKELEYKKLLAIENEDYETANLIKAELEKVKKSIMTIGDIPKPRGSSMSSRSIRTPASDGPMTAEDRMNPNRQIIHSIKQIESDLSRVYLALEKPDPSKYISQQYQINRTYEQSIRHTAGSVYDGMRPPGSAAHSQFQPSYISAGRQSIHGEEFPADSFIPGIMYEEVFDEKVVPMHNKDPIDFSKVKDDQKTKSDQQIGGETEEEKLSQQDKAKLEIMAQYFKPETVKLLLSKNWQSRRKGLESFIEEIPGSMKENGIAVQEHAINVFFNSCKEKLSQLTELAMKLFEVILEESKK